MKILYDNGAFCQTYGGVSRYYAEMMRRLPDDCQPVLTMSSTYNRYLRVAPYFLPRMQQSVHDFVRDYCGGRYWPGVSYLYRALATVFPRRFPSGERENDRLLDEAIAKGDFDVFHVTAPNYYGVTWKRVVGRKPIVTTVHDLVFDEIYHDKRTIRGRQELFAAASAIIAVSQHTKDRIIERYKVPEEKITVVYHGVDGLEDERFRGLEGERGAYLLYLGRRGGYKNWDWFLRAVAPMLGETLELVCTGEPFTGEEQALIGRLGVKKWVRQEYVSDEEMLRRLAHAIAFVYPSRYEGFGMPILDAWAVGCPVVLSRASCFPEIGGDAAEYFELDDAKSLVAAIERTKEKKTVEKGRQRLKGFSWEKCAAETAAVYRKVAG